MAIDITQVQYASTIDTFKNYPSTAGVISVPSESYTAGQFRTFTTTVALDREDATTQVLQNFSFDAGKYYIGTWVEVDINANFLAQTRMSISGGTLSVDLYVANRDAFGHTVPSFTLGIEVRRFIAPFS